MPPPSLRTSYKSLSDIPPPPLWTAEISSVGGLWILFGTTHFEARCVQIRRVSAIFSKTARH